MAQFEIVDDFTFEVCLLPRERALAFCDYLNSQKIMSKVKRKVSGHYAVYVTSSLDCQKAKQLLLEFGNSPYDKVFNQSSWKMGRTVSEEKEIRSGLHIPFTFDLSSITTIVELICIAVYFASLFDERTVISALALSKLDGMASGIFPYYKLLTPAFVHFSIMHIAFNLVMWEALARPIETVLKKKKLFTLFIALALISNVCQYSLLDGMGYFGGLSGVVYGVIGYSALVSRRDDMAGRLIMPSGLLTVSVIFILIGFFLSGIANFCHLSGLILGVALGYIDLKRKSIV